MSDSSRSTAVATASRQNRRGVVMRVRLSVRLVMMVMIV